MSKIRVAVVCGGRSEDFSRSVRGSEDIVAQLDPAKFEVALIVLDDAHRWYLAKTGRYGAAQAFELDEDRLVEVAVGPGGTLTEALSGHDLGTIDVVFPTIYGAYGEDGKLQGYLEMLDVPYVGAGVTSAAVCMDKDLAKRLIKAAGLDTTEAILLRSPAQADFDEAARRLGLPLFVKPCRLGSGVGTSLVRDRAGFERAVAEAFRYGRKVLVERASSGREVRAAVLGNEVPEVAYAVGEVPGNRIPAHLDDQTAARICEASYRAYLALEIEGMARIDWFLEADGRLLFGEANTLPCFSAGSTFRELWAHAGVDNVSLISRLIDLAIARFNRNRAHAYAGTPEKQLTT